MNKQKGFTLIELLAVIVILAIIAIITIPMITRVIDKARIGALEDSAYGLVESANLYYASAKNNLSETIEFICSKNECVNGEQIIKYKGNVDRGRIKIYKDGEISICIENDMSAAMKLAGETKVQVMEGECNYNSENYEIDETISLKKYDELLKKYEELKSKGNATSDEILKDKTAVVNGKEIIGTMPNNGELNWNPTDSTSYTIPAGYYSGWSNKHY